MELFFARQTATLFNQVRRHGLQRIAALGFVVAAIVQDNLLQAQCPDDWLTSEGILGVNGVAYTALTWNDGFGEALYVGGNFKVAGNQFAGAIARWDGTSWSSLDGSMGGVDFPQVRAMAVYEGELIAGGFFGTAGGNPAFGIARWNGQQWTPLGNGVGFGTIRALAVYNGELIVGGSFTNGGGQSIKYIARWNGANWLPMGGGALPMNSTVTCLTVHNGELYAGGGSFGHLLMRWNGSTWTTIATPGDIECMTIHNGMLTIGGAIPSGVNVWNGRTLQPLATVGLQGPQTNTSGANALVSYKGDLIATGSFTGADGNPVNHIAKWNGSNWSALEAGMNGSGYGLATFKDEVIVLGGFNIANATIPAVNIARWNGTWQIFGAGIGITDSNSGLRAILPTPDGLLVAGKFKSIGGQLISGIARRSGNQWTSFAGGINGTVGDLIIYNGELIAGGFFSSAGGVPVNNIARWDGQQWWPLGEGVNSSVATMTIFNGDLIVGGEFTSAGQQPNTSRLARWNGSSWSAIGSGFNHHVWDLSVYSGQLIAGGLFTANGSTTLHRIARWDGTTWITMGPITRGAPLPEISALAVHNGDLVASGNFITIGGVSADHIAKWNGTTWSPLGSGTHNKALALLSHDGILFAGGMFNLPTGPANRITQWNGQTWSQMGSGIDQSVLCIAEQDGMIYVGGLFSTAGDKVSQYFARWGPTAGELTMDLNCDDRVGIDELLQVINGWGVCTQYECPSDFDQNGTIDVDDLIAVIVNWS